MLVKLRWKFGRKFNRWYRKRHNIPEAVCGPYWIEKVFFPPIYDTPLPKWAVDYAIFKGYTEADVKDCYYHWDSDKVTLRMWNRNKLVVPGYLTYCLERSGLWDGPKLV